MQKSARYILIATIVLFFLLPALLFISFHLDFPNEESVISGIIGTLFEPFGIPRFRP